VRRRKWSGITLRRPAARSLWKELRIADLGLPALARKGHRLWLCANPSATGVSITAVIAWQREGERLRWNFQHRTSKHNPCSLRGISVTSAPNWRTYGHTCSPSDLCCIDGPGIGNRSGPRTGRDRQGAGAGYAARQPFRPWQRGSVDGWRWTSGLSKEDANVPNPGSIKAVMDSMYNVLPGASYASVNCVQWMDQLYERRGSR
jgi:hypothetical protein